MKKKRLLVLIGNICLIMVLAAMPFIGTFAIAASTSAKVCELTYTSMSPESHIENVAMRRWGAELEKRTGGQVKIVQWTYGGVLVKPVNVMESIGKGVADICVTQPGYVAALNPLTMGVNPVFYDDGYVSGYALNELYLTTPELQKEWEQQNNVKPIVFFRGARGAMGTRFEFNKLEELKGKKIRGVVESLYMVQRLGAIAITMAFGDIPLAIQKGTIDGYVGLPIANIYTNKLYQILKQVTDYSGMGCYMYWLPVGMNLGTYNKLPDSAKKVIDELSIETAEYYSELEIKETERALQACRENGVKIVSLSAEEMKVWRDRIDPLSIWEIGMKTAEGKGLSPRPIMDKFLKLLDKYQKQYPHKNPVEEFLKR